MTARDQATVASGVLASCVALCLAACGGENVLEALDPSLELLEYETRTVRVRYLDTDRVPIASASIRFTIKPTHAAGNGAIVETVKVTDENGVASVQIQANEQAVFLLVADADDAAEPARINVSVAKDSGGRMEVSVYQASSVEVIEAEVILVDDLDCVNFDEYEPPPATNHGVNTKRTVPIEPGRASDLEFRGLEPNRGYTVVAIGRSGTNVAARGCRSGLAIDQEMIDQKRSLSVAIDLEDILPSVGPNDLSVITKFKNNIALTGIAGLLQSMAGFRNGPADYVMNQLLYRTEDTSVMQRILGFYREQLAQELSGRDGTRQGAKLMAAASALASVRDVQLHSRMGIGDETEEGVITQELRVVHQMQKFTAVIESGRGQLVRRDFPLQSLADPRLRARRTVFTGSTVKLSAPALLKVENATRVVIESLPPPEEPHQFSLPLTDAILGQILFDNFGDWNLERIVGQMIYCDRAGWMAHQIAQRLNLYNWTDALGDFWGGIARGVQQITIQGIFTEACQEIVEDVLKEAQLRVNEELKVFRADQFIVLEGSAYMLLLGDGVTIGALKNGHWVGVGTFEAQR